MRKLIATLFIVAICTPVFSGELDGKGLWCDWQGFFFKAGGFELYSQDTFDSDNDGNTFEQYRVFRSSETKYVTSDEFAILYFKSQGYDSGIRLSRFTLKSIRFGCYDEKHRTCTEWVQCEVIDNGSEFNKRLIKEEDKAKKKHEQKLKKQKI